MKKLTLLKSLLLAVLLVGSVNVFGQATLPFSYDGGNPGTTITGLTQSGLGSDYASSPKMKFDTSGDNLVLYFNASPGTLSFKIKWNQSTAAPRFPGDFALMESDNGTDYTTVQLYNSTNGTALPNGTTVTETFNSLKSTTRYLKWVYTTKTNGNIALGAISLSASSSVAATPTFSPAAGTYTSAQDVTISSTTPGASIYYTTDGTDPNNTGNGTLYSSAISVTATTNIKAIAYALGYDPSAVASATYTINLNPTITVSETSLPAFSAEAGGSQSQNITVNGTNLNGDILLALSGTDATLFSLSQNYITPVGGSVTDQVITITYAPTSAGSHTATLTLSSTGATSVVLELSGSATLAQPTVTGASNIGKTSLTLNWNAVTDAAQYEVNVYTKDISGESTLLSEDFSNFSAGTTGSGADATDISGSLDTYTLVPGWTGSKVYQAGGTAKMGTSSALGSLVTPSLDLSGGEVTLSFKAMAWANDATELKIYVDDALAYTATGLNNTDYTLKSYSTTLTGGTTASKIKFEGKQASKGRFFLDDVVVTKKSYTPISGSPFTTTETSLQVSGLTAATTYYYTVTAKNGSYVSPASDEASASTLGTATSNVSVQGIFVRNGKVIVTAPAAGESIEIFNTVGQRLVSTLSTAGENEIAVPAKGILLVKAGSQVTKVMMP